MKFRDLMRLSTLCACIALGALVVAPPFFAKERHAYEQKPAPNIEDPSTVNDFEAGDKDREHSQHSTAILKTLHLARGDWVADVGAGDGYYSMRLSRIVGPDGKVFAEDIWDKAIEWSTKRVAVFGLSNVVVLKGRNDYPDLPEKSLTGVLVVNAYHHFTHYSAMDSEILKALRPGGRFVIADYSLPSHRAESRSAQVKIHEISPALVEAELCQAGFIVVRRKDPFIRRIAGVKNGDRIGAADMWLIVAMRPKL